MRINLFYFVLLLSFSACVTPRKVEKFLDKNPEFNAKNCADKFPVSVDTIVNYSWDTLNMETIKMVKGDTFIILQKGKTVTQVKTLVKTVTIVKENTARAAYIQLSKTADSLAHIKAVANLTKSIEILNSEVQKKDARIKKISRQRLDLFFLVILLLLWTLRKPILRLLMLV